jgi:hypothetical protein
MIGQFISKKYSMYEYECAAQLIGTNRTVVASVARSRQAFTATLAQNHGHFSTFHGYIP